MNQRVEIIPDEKHPNNISSCRVRRIGIGMEMCMVNAHCVYELPYGNLCAHVLAGQMAEAWEYAPRRAKGQATYAALNEPKTGT